MIDAIKDWWDDFTDNLKEDSSYRHRVIAGIVLILVGIFFLCSPIIKSHLVSSYQPNVSKATIAANQKKPAQYNYASIKRLSLSNIAKARALSGDITIVGEIAIPSNHIYLPISKGVTNINLALTAGTFRPDMKMGKGNYALAGHNMANHSKILFSPLYDYAKPGQKIYITDLNKVYTYKIYQRQIIDPHQVNVVHNTKKPITTLITCDETGSHRLMVRGKLVKKQSLKHAPKHIRKLFGQNYTNRN